MILDFVALLLDLGGLLLGQPPGCLGLRPGFFGLGLLHQRIEAEAEHEQDDRRQLATIQRALCSWFWRRRSLSAISSSRSDSEYLRNNIARSNATS